MVCSVDTFLILRKCKSIKNVAFESIPIHRFANSRLLTGMDLILIIFLSSWGIL